jgi:hypothetical protein
MRSIQSILAQSQRNNEINGAKGLPCGDYVYSDPMKIENRYESEAGGIRDDYGSIANWRLWERLVIEERETKRTVFPNELVEIIGRKLTASPEELLPLLDNSIYEVMTRSEWLERRGVK